MISILFIAANSVLYSYLYNDKYDLILDLEEKQKIANKKNLKTTFIEIENCSEKFNYISLFNYIYTIKKVNNRYSNINLRMNELQCPMCRNISKNLLPFLKNIMMMVCVVVL